jgi:hypothetical protein
MTKTEAKRIGIALVITAMILIPGIFFVTGVSLPLAEIVGMSEAENIRHFTGFRVVPPEWVTPGSDGLYISWIKTEAAVRAALVITIWIVALVFINPYNQAIKKSNNFQEGI